MRYHTSIMALSLLMFSPVYAHVINVLPVPNTLTTFNYKSKKNYDSNLDILIIGLEHNSDLINGREGLTSDRASLEQAFSTYEPQFSVDASANHSLFDKNAATTSSAGLSIDLKTKAGTSFNLNPSLNGTTTSKSWGTVTKGSTTYSTSWSVTQPLLQGSTVSVNASDLYNTILTNMNNTLSLKNSYNSTAVSLLDNTRQLRLNLYKQHVYKDNAHMLNQTLKKLELELKNGKKSKIDVVEAKLAIHQQQIDTSNVTQDIQNSMNNLTAEMGVSPESTFHLKTDNTHKLPPLKKVDDYIAAAKKYNITIRQAAISIEQSEISLNKSLDALKSSLSLSISGDFNNITNTDMSLSYSQNLNQSSQKTSVVQNKIAYQKAVRSYIRTESNELATIKTLYKNLVLARQNYALSEKSLQNNKERQNISRKQFEQGTMSSADYLANHKSYIDSLVAHYKSYNVYLKQYDDFLSKCGIILEEYNITLAHPVLEYPLDITKYTARHHSDT